LSWTLLLFVDLDFIVCVEVDFIVMG